MEFSRKLEFFTPSKNFSIEDDYESLTSDNIELNQENCLLRRELSNLSSIIVKEKKVVNVIEILF